MWKGMMGPESGLKAVFGSGKAGEMQRKRAGKIKTAKLPTSLDEMKDIPALADDEEIKDE